MRQERVFQNTFAPGCENRDLGVGQIIVGLSFGAIKYRALPPEVRKAVDKEMRRRIKEREDSPHADNAGRRARMLEEAQHLMRHGPEKGVPAATESRAGKRGVVAERARRKASGARVPVARAGNQARGGSCRL